VENAKKKNCRKKYLVSRKMGIEKKENRKMNKSTTS